MGTERVKAVRDITKEDIKTSKHKTLKRRHLDITVNSRRRDNVEMTSL